MSTQKRMLLVDDEEEIRSILKEFLEEEFSVECIAWQPWQLQSRRLHWRRLSVTQVSWRDGNLRDRTGRQSASVLAT